MAKQKLVRYVSPFGSPAWMTHEEAWRHLVEDDVLWIKCQATGGLSEEERRIGPPRIERGDRG